MSKFIHSLCLWDICFYSFESDSFSIVTKNKKKKERAEALKSKKVTGTKKRENQKGEEIKVNII